MRYVAAYLLASLGKGAEPTSADLEKILESVGIESDKDQVKKVISELKGKKLDDVIAEGNEFYLFMPGSKRVFSGSPTWDGRGFLMREREDSKTTISGPSSTCQRNAI